MSSTRMKIVAIVLGVLVLTSAAAGVAYGCWGGTLDVQGTVTMASVFPGDEGLSSQGNANFQQCSSDDPPGAVSLDPSACGVWTYQNGAFQWSGSRYSKDIASTRCWIDPCNNKILHVAVDNGYPCYSGSVAVLVHDGSCKPETLFDLSIDNPHPGAITVTTNGLAGVTISPGATILGSVCVHVEQPANQNSCYEFTITIKYRQEQYQACSHGYWKNHDWDGTGCHSWDGFDTVFGRHVFNNCTMMGALWLQGGGLNALCREATAALLNASHSGWNYPLTRGQVISMFQSAFDSGHYEGMKNEFENYNTHGT